MPLERTAYRIASTGSGDESGSASVLQCTTDLRPDALRLTASASVWHRGHVPVSPHDSVHDWCLSVGNSASGSGIAERQHHYASAQYVPEPSTWKEQWRVD